MIYTLRTFHVQRKDYAEFVGQSEEHVWPALESQGVRPIGLWLIALNPFATGHAWGLLGQVLSADHSYRGAVAHLIAHRFSKGQSACFAVTGAYCQARNRLMVMVETIFPICVTADCEPCLTVSSRECRQHSRSMGHESRRRLPRVRDNDVRID